MAETRIPTQKRSIEKRNKIIKMGFDLMCDKGYHNISTTEIAEYAGVSTGIIYQYFNDKKEIFIEGDEQRLEQVWTNIISNAIKYTNEGGLITITMKKNSKDIEISIEDTGIGMSKEVVSHIFERFYREDKARNVEGNGLGLAIVKSIVDLHHGKIDILSQVDVGTNFIVRLPIEKQKLIERLKR